MTPVRLIARFTLAGAALAAMPLAAAVAAAPPTVDAQHVQKGGTFPIDIPGQRPPIQVGDHLRHGQQLISRRVALGHGQRVNLVLTCPPGTVQRGLGIGSSTSVAFEVVSVRHYVGARRVRVLAIARVGAGHRGSGHVYGLCS